MGDGRRDGEGGRERVREGLTGWGRETKGGGEKDTVRER